MSKNTNHGYQKTLGNGYNRERKDKRIGKNKEIKIKNKEPEIKKTTAHLIKRENAKYLSDKSGDSLKQENKHFNILV